ncbi:hypothetical protein HW555_014213, partial [Spodoptera exigua]
MLMRRHRESMQKVNAFFSNLAIVLNKEKTVWNKTEEETDRNHKGVQQTIHLNLRAGSLANIFRSSKINKPLFLFPGRIENVLGTSARTGPTTGNKFKKSSSVKPTTVTLWSKALGYESSTYTKIKSFRPPNLPNIDSAYLFSPISSSTKTTLANFIKVYNLIAEVANLNQINSTSSPWSAYSTVPITFNKFSTSKPKLYFDKSLEPSSFPNYSEITTISSTPKTSGLLAPLSTFNATQFSISNLKPSSLKSNMPPCTPSSYKLTTDKFLGLWQQEMSNFASPDRWKIEGKYFTTQRISPGWHLNVGKIQPFAQHRRNGINRTTPSRRIDLQHNIIKKSYKSYSYLTTKQYKAFIKKSYGNLNVSTQNEEHSTFKTTVIDGRLVYLPLHSAKATTEGLVSTLSTKSPNHHYYEMMNELDEGYMMIFLIELCRIISEQDLDHVQAVIIHMETIIDELYKNGSLTWLGTPLLDITVKLSRLMFERPVDLIRSQAATMYYMLRERKHALSVEVNLIIDYADFFYDDEEGEALFNSLSEFEAFPDYNSSLFVSKTFDLLCSSLIENFLHPFHRLQCSDRRQRLIDFVNKVIRDKFPKLTSKILKQKRLDSKIKARETKHLPQLRAIMNLQNEIKRKLHLKHKQRNLRVHNLRKKIKGQRKERFNRRQMKER